MGVCHGGRRCQHFTICFANKLKWQSPNFTVHSHRPFLSQNFVLSFYSRQTFSFVDCWFVLAAISPEHEFAYGSLGSIPLLGPYFSPISQWSSAAFTTAGTGSKNPIIIAAALYQFLKRWSNAEEVHSQLQVLPNLSPWYCLVLRCDIIKHFLAANENDHSSYFLACTIDKRPVLEQEIKLLDLH
jgi:hypothetical protein